MQSLQNVKDTLSVIEYTKIPDRFKDARDTMVAIEYNQLSQEAIEWIKAHPYQTLFYITNGVVILAPGLATGPFLSIIGFGPLGPKAGTSVLPIT